MKPLVFISYARPDLVQAERLYSDLRKRGLELWMDKQNLRAGEDWAQGIAKAISNSRYFIALISSNSVERHGFVQTELKHALNELDKYPESDVFIIPARLDDTPIEHSRLKKLHWVDLSPDWNSGVAKILLAMEIEGGLGSGERDDLPRDKFFMSGHWTDEGLEIKGGSIVIPPSETRDLFKSWLEWLPRFISQEESKASNKEELLERAFILASLRACHDVDLPLNIHPAAIRATAVNTPSGAV